MEIIKTTIIVIVIIISIISILLVLMQSSRGSGGLFGDAGGSQSIIGSDRKGDFLSKLTSIFLAIFMGGSLFVAYLEHSSNAVIKAPDTSSIQDENENDVKTDLKKEETTKKEIPQKENKKETPSDINIKIDKTTPKPTTKTNTKTTKKKITTETKNKNTKNKDTKK